MTAITHSTPYTSGHLYSSAGDTSGIQSGETTDNKTEDSPAVSGNQDVKVSLSPEVQAAKLREAMGLNPTGRLKREDFMAAAEAEQKNVDTMLSKAMADLGIDSEQTISLSLDGDSELTIEESFPGKSTLLEVLNGDEAFTAAFGKLSANRQVVDYTSQLTGRQTSLADFMGEDTGWDGIMSLARQYEATRARGNSLEDLLGVSRAQAPYTYVHGETRTE